MKNCSHACDLATRPMILPGMLRQNTLIDSLHRPSEAASGSAEICFAIQLPRGLGPGGRFFDGSGLPDSDRGMENQSLFAR